jgi:glycerol uptake facilitator-like aquaporin
MRDSADARAVLAEGLGTALLICAVIGSGIMGERLAGGNVAIALLANTFATVGALFVLIEIFAPISGAHFNPAISLAMRWRGELPAHRLLPYIGAQLCGALLGAWLANVMFELPVLQLATKVRGGAGQWIGELVATAGLLLLVLRAPRGRVSAMVAGWIGAAYWFTSSTSFANPAAAFGRMFSDSFAGIAPAGVPAFVVAELAGAALGLLLHQLLGSAAALPTAVPRNLVRKSGQAQVDGPLSPSAPAVSPGSPASPARRAPRRR